MMQENRVSEAFTQLQGFDDFVRSIMQDWKVQGLFDRLEMGSSNFSIIDTVQNATDFSHPYKEEQDEVKEIPFYGAQGAIGPAGAIVSNIVEMSRWALMNLNKGKYRDTHIVSESQIALLHAPQMVVPETGKYAEMPYSSYALGWFVTPYRGHPMIQHGGNIDGFSSLTTLFPQDTIGVAVLTNMGGTPVPSMLTFNIFDRFLSLDEIPWSERFRKDYDQFKEAEQKGKEKSESDRVPDTHLSHPEAIVTQLRGVFTAKRKTAG